MHLPYPIAAAMVFAGPLAAQGTTEAPEPNETPATAAALTPGAQAFGTIAPSGDADWFRITLNAPADLRAWTGPGFQGPVGDTLLALLDAQGALLAEVDDGNQATHGFYSILNVGAAAAGTYFLRVRGFGTATGSYTLDVVAAPPGSYVSAPSLQPLAERPEINDVRLGGAATSSLLFSHNTGNIVLGGGGTSWSAAFAGSEDYDFFAFSVVAPVTVTLATNAGAGTAPGDTVLHLVDASFTRLAFDDDSGPGAYSQLTFALPGAGLYYAVVNGFAAGNAGNYVLDILGPAPAVPGSPASVTVHAGGCAGPSGTPWLGVRSNSFGCTCRPELPVLGSTFVADVTHLPAQAMVLTLLDLLPAGSPLQLTGLGAPGCVVEIDLARAWIGVQQADPAGVCFWSLATPYTLVLCNLPLEMQVAALDQAANALGVVVSNRCSAVCGTSH